MKNNFLKNPVTNILLKPYSNSEVVSQILYGEKFEILSKKKKWIKIKTYYDKYVGYIKESKFIHKFKPTNKICTLRASVFKKKNGKFQKTNYFLYFSSGISIKNQNKNFIEYEKNRWVKKKDIKSINHYEKSFVKIFKLFLNTKYLWGGKTSKGIDCSALIQIYFYYNRVFFPRDTKDQIKFCKKKLIKKFFKGDIIFWKGHVGICLNSKKIIHAYGPRKKVLIMPIKDTIKIIDRSANLKIKKISNILRY